MSAAVNENQHKLQGPVQKEPLNLTLVSNDLFLQRVEGSQNKANRLFIQVMGNQDGGPKVCTSHDSMQFSRGDHRAYLSEASGEETVD